MTWSFQGTDAAAHSGVDICSGGCYHNIGKGGVIAAAMVRMKHEYGIEKACFFCRELLVLSQQAQEILSNGVFRIGIMDEQALPVIIVHLALVCVACNGWQLCQQVHALYQGLVYVCIIRIVIIIIKGQDSVHQFIHQVLAGKAQQVHFHEFIRNGIAASYHVAEFFQFRLLGKVSEQQEETYLLIPKVAALLTVYQIQHIDSAVKQTAWNGLNPFFRLLISNNIRHPGKANADTGPVLIAKALFYIVFLIPFVGDICIILGLAIKLRKIAFLNHCHYSSLKPVPEHGTAYACQPILLSVPAAVIINQAACLYNLPFLRGHIRNI